MFWTPTSDPYVSPLTMGDCWMRLTKMSHLSENVLFLYFLNAAEKRTCIWFRACALLVHWDSYSWYDWCNDRPSLVLFSLWFFSLVLSRFLALTMKINRSLSIVIIQMQKYTPRLKMRWMIECCRLINYSSTSTRAWKQCFCVSSHENLGNVMRPQKWGISFCLAGFSCVERDKTSQIITRKNLDGMITKIELC